MDRVEELTGVEFWPLMLGLGGLTVFFAIALTWPVCALVLWRYRTAVHRGMRQAAGPRPPSPVEPDVGTPGPRPHITIEDVHPDQPVPLMERAHGSARRAQYVFASAAVVFGLASTAVYYWVEGLGWAPVRSLSLVLILGWLVVPTIISLGVVDHRWRWGLWGGYLAAVLALSVLGGTSALESLLLLLVVVAFPGLLVVATGVRSMRGAAWLVAPALTALAMAALMLYPVVLYLVHGVTFDALVWWLIAISVAVVASVALYAWAMAALYEHKWISDESLLVIQWWFVLALTQVMLLGTQGAGAALLAAAPFCLMVLFLVGAALTRRRSAQPSVRLLLLRTFGARRRSSRLLRDLTMHWRWVGSVELITGTDLATEVLEPHELLDFLRRRLSRRFVRDQADLDRRVRDLDLGPDRDGRYRVNDLLCHDDTWRPAVQALVGEVDAVLVDLRGLTPGNLGVVHELERLVALFPLDRVVGLTDVTTDEAFLRWALDRAAHLAPAQSPLLTDAHPALQVVRLSGRRTEDLRHVLNAVASAATQTPLPSESAGAQQVSPDTSPTS